VSERQAGRLGELLQARLAAERWRERSGGANLLPALDDVDREADRPRLVRNRARDRLAESHQWA
jgi:hypothetical protein